MNQHVVKLSLAVTASLQNYEKNWSTVTELQLDRSFDCTTTILIFIHVNNTVHCKLLYAGSGLSASLAVTCLYPIFPSLVKRWLEM